MLLVTSWFEEPYSPRMLRRHGPGISPLHGLAHLIVDFSKTRNNLNMTTSLSKIMESANYA